MRTSEIFDTGVSDSGLIDRWWLEPDAGDQSMEDEHDDHWREFLSYVEEKDLSTCSVLDFGCNQGAMLRMLYDDRPFATAVGVDLAQESIAVAESRKGNRPISYEAVSSIAHHQENFDIALSSAVIYLIKDMKLHAREVFQALKPGGVYYASHPDYPSFPNFEQIKRDINQYAAVPLREHSLEQIAAAFDAAGFKVGIKRVVPTGYTALNPGRSWFSSVADNIEAIYRHRYVWRFFKPIESAPSKQAEQVN